jgi:uncharacterized protein (TIGR03437 family)
MNGGKRRTVFAAWWALVLGLSQNMLLGQHSTTPVLLVNGFQLICPDSPAGTFGKLPSQLLADGAASVDFFDTCGGNGSSIESLAGLLTSRIQSYPGQVDVIAHSMGGLVVRAYLQGWTASPLLNPPANPKIRKLILLGTPNTGVSNLFSLWPSNQVAEMQFGSPFLWFLATWNQQYDDLRGVDTLAIVGTAGSSVSGIPSDGVVDVASAALTFWDSSGVRTRAVPYCHAGGPAALFCTVGAPAIANVSGPSHLSYQLVRSFLDGRTDWTTIAPQASSISNTGGVLFSLGGPTGGFYANNQLTSVALTRNGASYSLKSPVASSPIRYNDGVPAGPNYTLTMNLSGQQISLPGVSIPASGYLVFPLKLPPWITLVAPSAASPPGALSVASDSLISIYGAGISSGTVQASVFPPPVQLGDVTMTIGGVPVRLLYVSAQQINAVVPSGLVPGLYSLVLSTSQGKHSINLMIEQTVPALFALANNAAAAEHASTGQVVTTSNAATAGEYVSIIATGLGPTIPSNGLSIAATAPTVLIGGRVANVTFAGRAPGFFGLDQINVQIPEGVQPGTLVPVVVTSRNHSCPKQV